PFVDVCVEVEMFSVCFKFFSQELPAEDLSRHIEILVSDPKKVGDGMSAYVTYKVTTRVSIFRVLV
ncbi:MAG: hypothetical protein MUE85_00425, partial [Microscillaceae bacterium]|nr:hypothetical protein [Microscillaceae bacterium]